LSLFGANMTLVSPKQLRIPEFIKSDLRARGIGIRETESLESVMNEVDVLYVTRIQRERFPDHEEYMKVAGVYRITGKLLDGVRDNLIIMHPLPRIDEIAPDVDRTKHAKYFEQAFYGVPVRMALLSMLLEAE